MTKSDQINILNNKIKASNAQYRINRLNAEISAFSEGDLDKYEFLTRKDLKYKPNALDKAKFEFSPLGKAFNQGLDKKAENYKEEGVIKLLKDIRDKIARPIGGNNGDNDDNGDNGGNNDDNGNDKDDKDDRDNGNNGDNKDSEYDDEYLLKLDRLLKNLKDDKKSLKTFSENIDDKSKEELEAEELDRRFKKLTSKKCLEALTEYLKEAGDADLRSRVDALRKRLNNPPETSSNETSNETSDETSDETIDDNEGDDSEENQISNFVDSVLKKVSEEILNNDNNDNNYNKENADLKSEVDVF